MPIAYKRVLLKLSGEALMGDDTFGINRVTIERMVADMAEVVKLGVQLAVVIGGGGYFRGVAGGAAGMDRCDCRLHGYARHHDECAGAAGRNARHAGIEARVRPRCAWIKYSNPIFVLAQSASSKKGAS